MAVESTPVRSFSDLFRTSRAAEATTGWTTGASLVPEVVRRHHGPRASRLHLADFHRARLGLPLAATATARPICTGETRAMPSANGRPDASRGYRGTSSRRLMRAIA